MSDECKVLHNARSGQFHPRAKLTDREVELIRFLHENLGLGYAKLAAKFEISKTQAARICRYQQR